MNPLYAALVYVVWFFATYYLVFIMLSMFLNRGRIYEKKQEIVDNPQVSVIVPAFNEEASIRKTIASLKKVHYDNVEFIILNDGSTDDTASIIRKMVKGDARFTFVDNKSNKGKAATLNQGIGLARGEFIACMDADSIIEGDVFSKVLPYFRESDVGAVTISVDVKDPQTVLEHITALEFLLGLSLFLKVASFFNCIFVTPGPFSVYRASVLRDIGGFDENNITEDHEIAFRIHKGSYKIKSCMQAKVYTILPEGFMGIYRQRRRWYSGALYTLWQHKDAIFNRRLGLFGFFVPYNFTLIVLGLALFGATTYLSLSNIVDLFTYFSQTGFNFLDHLAWDFDVLKYGQTNVLGVLMFFATIFTAVIGIKFSRQKFSDNKLGLLTYPLLFFLYQIYWIGAVYSVVRRRKVRWR